MAGGMQRGRAAGPLAKMCGTTTHILRSALSDGRLVLPVGTTTAGFAARYGGRCLPVLHCNTACQAGPSVLMAGAPKAAKLSQLRLGLDANAIRSMISLSSSPGA